MKTALAIIVVILVAAGAYFLFAPKTHAPVTNPVTGDGTSAPLETTNPPPADTNAPSVSAGASASVSANAPVTVMYNGTSFSPATVTVKKGGTVTFVNTSGSPMWIASNPHPIHSGYSGTTVDQHCPDAAGTAFDQCATGASYTFTFQKVGTWGYHNHANHGATGTIVVTQ